MAEQASNQERDTMTHTPEIASLPCGCKFISREYANGEYGAIDFCPLHKAAPDLLETLEGARDHLNYIDYGRDAYERECAGDLDVRIDAAIAKAQP